MKSHWIAGAMALCVGMGLARGDESKPVKLPPELAWVPANCVGFAHVRFAELWDSPAGKALGGRTRRSTA
jgi:hypothetical protein